MDRRDLIMDGLRPDGLGLEIGGGYGPIAAGVAGLDVRTLDHLPTEELIAKYRDMGVDTSKVVPVDYVWSGERYRDLVGETRFDWIVASHVIEHVPDLVGFINQCGEILAPGGMLALAIPDRRYTFDYYRPETGLAELIDAHLQGRTVSTPGAAADHFLNHAELNGAGVWRPGLKGAPRFVIPAELAAGEFARARTGAYVDVHAWVFSPSRFRLAIADLNMLGLLDLREARFHDTSDCEFIVHLSATGAGPDLDRQTLAERIAAEQQSEAVKNGCQALAMEAAHLREERDTLAREAARLDQTLQAATAEIGRLREALCGVRASSSWRITAPLRNLGAAFNGRARRRR